MSAARRWLSVTVAVVALWGLGGCERKAAPLPSPAASPSAQPAPQPTSQPQSTFAEPPAPMTARPGWRRPPVIDVHTHVTPSSYDLALQLAEENGVERIVNLSGGNQIKGLGPHLEAIERHPGRVAVFYNLPWQLYEREDFGAQAAAGLGDAVKRGYAGLKIPKVLGLGLTDAQGNFVPVDDPKLDPVWAAAGRLGVPVAIHTGDPVAFFKPVDEHNERHEELALAPNWSFADPKFPRLEVLLAQRDRLLERHRGTTFLLVHFGGLPEDLAYTEALMERHPNVVLDVSARLGEIGRHDPARLRAFFTKHASRILFGTDLGVSQEPSDPPKVHFFLGSVSEREPAHDDVEPFFHAHWRFFEEDAAQVGTIPHPIPIQGRWGVRPLNLPDEVLKALYHDNAHRLIFAPMYARLQAPDPLSPAQP